MKKLIVGQQNKTEKTGFSNCGSPQKHWILSGDKLTLLRKFSSQLRRDGFNSLSSIDGLTVLHQCDIMVCKLTTAIF